MAVAAQTRLQNATEKYRNGSPSRWQTRAVVAVLAIAGAAIASYLAAYQFGLTKQVYEPFFGTGAKRVLHSFIARLLPLPDAALGAIAYVAEVIASVLGGSQRYHTHPVLVLCYGIIVIAAAATAIALLLIQLGVIHTACTLCICSAAISLLVAYFASDEILAALEVVYEKRKTS